MNKLKRIFVLESIFDEKELHDGGDVMVEQLSPTCQANEVELKRSIFYSLREFLAELKYILETSNTNEGIAIHLICHGASDAFLDGLVYKIESDYIPIAKQLNRNTNIMSHDWNALRSELAEINIKTGGNLFLSMCVCYGANIFDGCNSPFAKYVVASKDQLYKGDIKQTFVDIYSALITSQDVDIVKRTIETTNARCQGRSQLALYDGINPIN